MRTVDSRWKIIQAVLPIAVGLCIEINLIKIPDNAILQALSTNGLTAGSVVVVLMAVISNLVAHRRHLEVKLSVDSMTQLQEFIDKIVSSRKWDDNTRYRLEAIVEEALIILTEQKEPTNTDTETASYRDSRRLHLVVDTSGSTAVLEFISTPNNRENLQERIAILKEPDIELSDIAIERDVGLRLLRHYSKSVAHHQYQEAEIISAVVKVKQEQMKSSNC